MRRRLAGVVIIAVLVSTGLTTTAIATDRSSSGYRAAQATNPFTDQNVFCKSHPALPGRNSSSPGVGVNQINITDMSIDATVLRRFGTDLQDFNAAFRAFWNEVNKCGGINGRKINLKTAKYNLIAPDFAGHLQALCLKATEDHKAFVVVGTGPPQVQRCVSVQHKSIMVASTGVLDSEFRDSRGRIITVTPGSDASAEAFIKDAKRAGTFRNKKVGILGSNSTSTAVQDQQRQYVDGFKRAGVDVEAYEVLPCSGTVCTAQLTPTIARLKAKGVDAIVLTQHVSVTTLGSIWREMRVQNLRTPVYNAFTDSLNGDSTLAGLVRAAGTDGANFAENVGWYTTNLYLVHNAWRVNQAKETAFGKMCTATLAKANNERRYEFNERDISNGRWGGTVNICQQVRAVAQAIWTLGANVTTDRMVTALKAQRKVDQWDTSTPMTDKQWFMDGQTEPHKAMAAKFHFPCPQPRSTPGEGCFLPVDRPARVRNIPA